MADYQPLPDDDESPASLREAADDYLRAALPGWAPSDAAVEVALRAAFADEGAVLYSLLREVETDRYRDFGTVVLGVPAGEATPATTTATFTARDDQGPYQIEAGLPLVIDAPGGPVAFEVVTDTTIANGDTTAAGVLVQALAGGSQANGATGTVMFDEPPAWLASVSIDAPASGGSDGQTDEEQLDAIKAHARLLHVAAILDEDYEMVAQQIDGVTRCLVLDLYDAGTDTPDVEGAVTLCPIDDTGAGVSPAKRTEVKTLIVERSVINDDELVYVIAPTLNAIAVKVTVARKAGYDDETITADVDAAVRDVGLSKRLWGQPELGQRRRWLQRRVVRLYQLSDVIDDAASVEYVDELQLAPALTVTAAAATDVFTSTAHGYSNDDEIYFTALTGGAPVTEGTAYYVRDAATDTFKIAATPGAGAIDITTDLTAGLVYRPQPANVTMTGPAPLPDVAVVLVTIVDPS